MHFAIKSGDICLRGVAHYPYSPAIRHLILSAKIRRDASAIQAISSNFLAKMPSFFPAATIIPVPSSVESKIYSRFDIALMLADLLAKNTESSLRLPPWQSQFNIGKQTFSRKKFSAKIRISKTVGAWPGACDIVLVDDVVTSGQSLLALANRMGLTRGYFVTFAFAGVFCV